ncbi:hypothetical protein [Streptomyces venezuelae]|uniref:hypothetical protein n=1 Tax=Streptomyces venezuelae TaxID=54571 RepID=UPI00341C0815
MPAASSEEATSLTARKAELPAQSTPGAPGPEQTAAPATEPEPSITGEEIPPGDDTTPGEEAGTGGTTSPAPAATPGSATGPTAEQPHESEDDPVCNEESDEAAISTTLHGLPSKVVAGSGWHTFTYRATNTSDKAMKSVDSWAMLSAIGKDNSDDVTHLLTLQWYDKDTGVWGKTVDDYGYFTSRADLAPGEHADTQLRLKADASTPASYGFAFATGAYHDENDVCGYSSGSEYEFDIVGAGSEPGNVPPATGKPAQGNRPVPQGGSKDTRTASNADRTVAHRPGVVDDSVAPVDSDASLAETGSDAASGWILGAGGTSIALGTALAAAAARRRRRHTA